MPSRTRLRVPRAPFLLLLATLSQCTEHPLSTAVASGTRLAEITPVYDSTGQPVSDYYSANSTISWSADSSFEPAGAQFSRSYFEQYTWQTSYDQWYNQNTFSTGDQPFDSNPPPVVDVASFTSTFGQTAPQIQERSGATLQLPTTRPSLKSDTSTYPPFQAAPPLAIRALGAAAVRASSPPKLAPGGHRAAALERLVVTPQTTTQVLKRLRATFVESAGDNGAIHFSQIRGASRVDITFNPGVGAITRMEASDSGLLRARTDYRYDPIPGGQGRVLSNVVTTQYGANGHPSRVTTQSVSNVTVR